MRISFGQFMAAAGLSLIVTGVSLPAVSGQWRVQLIRGSTTVGQGVGATEAAAWADCQSKIPGNATSSTVYACQTMRYYATVTPDPVCPPAPAQQTRQATCPTGTTGTWTQTGTSSVGAPPACTVTTTWAPATAPSGACTAVGAATLRWTPPTQNTNGSALTNLAGYRIHYGTSASALTQTIQLANAGLTSHTVSNLPPGAYYFAVRAYTSNGTESDLSNVVSKSVQ